MWFFGQDFEDLCEQKCRRCKVYADIYEKSENGEYTLSNTYTQDGSNGEPSVVSVKIVKGLTSGSFSYGGAFSGQLTLVTTANAQIPFDNAKIVISVSFVSDEGAETARKAPLGTFFVESVSASLFTKTVKAVDGIAKLTKYYTPQDGDFPMSALKLYEKIGKIAGVSATYERFLSLNNPTITEPPIKNAEGEDKYYTYRELAGMVASINAGNAYINAYNELDISTPDIGLKRNIPIESVISYTDAEAVNSFTTTFWAQNYEGEGTPPEIDPLSLEYDPSIMVIDFPLSTDSSYATMQANIDQQIGGISYNGIIIKKQGTGRQEIGDLLAFSDTYRNKTFDNVLVMGIVYDISAQNGFTETLYSLSQSEAKQQAKGVSLSAKIDKVEAAAATKSDDENPPTDTEIIHFKRDGIEYGAVGIHDVDGKAGVALSIAEASKWLALVDENGEKILEYVPTKTDKTKPYEIKEGLWFIPVKSKNVPSFEGIYVQCPYHSWPSGITTEVFTNLSDMISADPEAETLPQCTLFADSDEAVNFYKQLGFERVYNIQAFENDEWEIVGLKSDSVNVAIAARREPFGLANELSVHVNDPPFGTSSNVLRSGKTDYYSKYFAFFWTAPYITNQERQVANAALYAVYEKADQTQTPIGFRLKGGGFGPGQTLNQYSYEALWGEYINPSPRTKELRIYKNIVLMNGAKILNEDGTEF